MSAILLVATMMISSVLIKSLSVKVSLLLISLSFICMAAYNFIGSTIDKNGFLHEPFFLIPIGWLFLFSGIVLFIFAVLKMIFTRRCS